MKKIKLKFPKLPFDLYDVLIFGGAAVAVYGIWLIYHPAAFVIGGAACIYVGLLGVKPAPKEKE